jgi:hypothetical protein
MPYRGFIFQYLLIVPHVLLIVVLIALVRRRLYREYPIFLAYIVVEIAQAIIMIPLIESPATTGSRYSIPYAVSLAATTALRFGIIQEIFVHVLRGHVALAGLGKPVFRWVTVGLLSIALLLTIYAGPNTHQSMFMVYLFDRFASILQSGLLVGLFLFSSSLGLSWRSHAFGIALGVGVIASVNLAASAIWYETGYTYSTALNYLIMVVFHCSVLIWIFYLFAPERRYAAAALPQHDLETWNLELERLLKQ